MLMLALFPLGGRAQQTEVGAMPDFLKCFRLLEANRITYNLYNDSIFLIKDHDQWVNFFRRRALKNHQLFSANKVIISEVLNYFKQDRSQIPQEAYSSLLHGLHRLFAEDKMDPFLGNEFANILMDYYNSGLCPDSLNYKALVDNYKGGFYWEMYTQGLDTTFMHKSYDYFRCPLREDRYKSPSYIETSLMALEKITVTNWLVKKKQTIGEYMGYIEEMKALLKLPNRPTRIISEKDYKIYENLLEYTDERMVRNVYLADTTVMEKHVADSLMRMLVERNLSDPNLSDLSFSRTLLMQMKLGQLTAKQALGKMDSIYARMRERFYQKRFDARQLRLVLMPFTNYFYINDVADISFAKKRKRVKRLAHDIVEIYHRRIDQQGNNNYVRYLNLYASYPRVIKYLTEKERIHYLNELNVATQVTTYAHSKHVSMIAEVLMKGILKYQPELLVDVLGDGDVDHVRKHGKKYIEFIQNAGMYHDLGKNSIE